jgi:hypothetical protein
LNDYETGEQQGQEKASLKNIMNFSQGKEWKGMKRGKGQEKVKTENPSGCIQ